jgi:hypothetical protein
VTEDEWLECEDQKRMVTFLEGRSRRKLVLFFAACCRCAWHPLDDEKERAWVEGAERIADGLPLPVNIDLDDAPNAVALGWYGDYASRDYARRHRGCDLLREVFGNPFRPPPTIDPAWLTWNDGTVVRLAQSAYEERHLPAGTLDNGRLAVLADALEEAGCTDADILGHLRGPGPHVRGCWPVDLCLGKS